MIDNAVKARKKQRHLMTQSNRLLENDGRI